MVNFEIPWHSQWEEERLISLGRRASGDPDVVALWDAIEHDNVKQLKQILQDWDGCPHFSFVRQMNDGFYSPLAEAYYSNSVGCAEVLLENGALPVLGDRYHLKVYKLRDFLNGKGFNFTYSGENRKKWEEICEMEEALHEGRPVPKKLDKTSKQKSSDLQLKKTLTETLAEKAGKKPKKTLSDVLGEKAGKKPPKNPPKPPIGGGIGR